MSPVDGPLTFPRDWPIVRRQFSLTQDIIEMSAMAMASNPKPVADAIEAFRLALDNSPQQYAMTNNGRLARAVFASVGDYFGVDPGLVAYTHSTTVGLAQLYGGIRLAPGQEILTSVNEHFTTTEALVLRGRRDGTPYRQVPLFRDSRTVSDREIVENISAAIRPCTRVLALTWVYSTDGVKLPIKKIAEVVRDENDARPPHADRLLLVVDGVHGFGVENVKFADLGCDLFAAGCHKWIFGPRGTAMMCGTPDGWREVTPIIPSFSSAKLGQAQVFMPGGTFPFEHFWAVASAFAFLQTTVGKANVEARVHGFCTAIKAGLGGIKGVTVRTPVDEAYSAGIVAFDVDRLPAGDVVTALADPKRGLAGKKRISATQSAFDMTGGRTHVRLSPAIFNTDEEVVAAIDAVSEIAGA